MRAGFLIEYKDGWWSVSKDGYALTTSGTLAKKPGPRYIFVDYTSAENAAYEAAQGNTRGARLLARIRQ